MPFRLYNLLVILLFASACSSSPTNKIYRGMFYSDKYFVDPRALFDDQNRHKKEFSEEIYIGETTFEKSDLIAFAFDETNFVFDHTGYLPTDKKYFYDRASSGVRITINIDFDGVEVVELLDLQAKGGCLDNKPHPINLAVARIDPSANIHSITFSINTPCRRYYAEPESPYESLLMVKVKTVSGFYYNIYKMYSFSDECLGLTCNRSDHEGDFYGG